MKSTGEVEVARGYIECLQAFKGNTSWISCALAGTQVFDSIQPLNRIDKTHGLGSLVYLKRVLGEQVADTLQTTWRRTDNHCLHGWCNPGNDAPQDSFTVQYNISRLMPSNFYCTTWITIFTPTCASLKEGHFYHVIKTVDWIEPSQHWWKGCMFSIYERPQTLSCCSQVR